MLIISSVIIISESTHIAREERFKIDLLLERQSFCFLLYHLSLNNLTSIKIKPRCDKSCDKVFIPNVVKQGQEC